MYIDLMLESLMRDGWNVLFKDTSHDRQRRYTITVEREGTHHSLEVGPDELLHGLRKLSLETY